MIWFLAGMTLIAFGLVGSLYKWLQCKKTNNKDCCIFCGIFKKE